MRIINEKYRINKLLNNSRFYSMYEAVDITKNNIKVNVYILNSIHIEKNLIEICINEYEKVNNLNDLFINILEFTSTINTSSKEKSLEYFYVTESISEYEPLVDVASQVSEEQLIEIYVDICRMAQEQCYNYIKTIPFSVENIYISKDNKVKLKDKITALLDCREIGMPIHYDSKENHKDVIFTYDKISHEKYYVDKLKEILVNIVFQNKGVKLRGKFQAHIHDIVSNEKQQEYFKLIGKNMETIIYNIYNSKNEIDKILDIICEINKVFNTAYSYISNKTEKLNLNIPIVGRDEEIYSIVKSINQSLEKKTDENIILIHGEIGIGKTRLISHIHHLINTNYKNKLQSFYINNNEDTIAIINLIKQVILKADKSLLSKYRKELVSITPEVYNEEKAENLDNKYQNIRNNFTLMVKLSLFLLEYCSDNKSVIILDNVHMYDSFSIGIIQYILSKSKYNKNIPVIISYRDGDCLSNIEFTEMLTRINSRVDLEIHLSPLSEEMTSRVLKNILNTSKISESFTDLMYRYSMGNPLLVEEGIKYLTDKKVIYIDKEYGMWKKVSNHEIYMSRDMEEICRNQLLGLKGEYIDMLYEMAYFYTPVNIYIISKFLNISKEKVNEVITDLTTKGILSKTQSNKTVKYSFYNKFLKNYLYRSIDEKLASEKHNKIVNILMEYDKEMQADYIDEIIYHLEKVKDKKVLEYYKSRKTELEALKKFEDAIKFNFKILNFISKNSNHEDYREEQIAANISLGELYNKMSEKKTSIDYYLVAKNLCNDERYLNEYIDILKEIIFISIDLGYEDNVNRYLKEMRAAVKKSDYRIGKIKYLLLIIWRKYNKQEYDKVKELCQYGISLCKEEDEEYRLSLMNYYSDVLAVEGRELEGLEYLKEIAIKCEELNFTKRLCRVTNSMGVLYSDYLQYHDKAVEQFKKSYEFGIDEDDEYYKINSLSNLGFSYYVMIDYNKAYEYFNNSSNTAIDSEILASNFYNFSYIGTILYKQGKYNESYRYAKLCSHYIDKEYSKYWQEAAPYCIFMYYISDIIGNIDEAKKYLQQGLEILGDSKSVVGYEIVLLHNIYCLCHERNNASIESLIKVAEKILYVDFRVSMLCYCVNKLIYLGFEKDALEVYKYILSNKEKIKSEINKAEIKYLGIVLKQKSNYKKLINSLDLIKDKNLILSCKMNFEIANGYYREGNYIYTAEYIYECCGDIIDVLEGIPDNYVKNLIKANPYIVHAFELLIKIKQHYGLLKSNISIENNLYKVKNITLYFKELMKQSIVNSKFLRELKGNKEKCFYRLDNLEEVLTKINSDMNENFNNICKYINSICFSTTTSILVENEGNIRVVASTDEKRSIPDDLSIINLVRNKKTAVISKDKRIISLTGQVLSYDVDCTNKTIMCIPITKSLKGAKEVNNEEFTNDLVGYIYVESSKRINNINVNTIKKCAVISRILYLIIDRDNVRKSSSIDNLTSTLMRKHLEMFIQEQIEKSYIYSTEFSIIMLDIDKFKEINDNYGHRMGDQVLSKLCKTIFNNIRRSDVIGRYGGEEFVVVLPDIGTGEAESIAERIRKKIKEEKLLGDKREVTVSMGVASYPNHATTYDELIEKSDQALYEAKNEGRNRTKVWNEAFGYRTNTSNRLSGIFVGNGDQDYKNVSTLIEFIDLLNEDISVREKIVNAINRIAEITEAESCTLYSLNNNEINSLYCKSVEPLDTVDEEYNYLIVSSAISSNENVCGIDWSCMKNASKSICIPNIKSNMVVLLRNKKEIIGAIHLSSSIKYNEFNYDQLNYINTLAKMMVPMLEDGLDKRFN